MSKRSKAKKQEAAKHRSEALPAPALPPANPPRPNVRLFIASCVLLALWIVFLMVLAVWSLQGN